MTVRVVINRAVFGQQVTASPAIGAHLAALAAPVAAAADGQVELITEPASAGGSRVRARVANGSSDREEADTNRLTAALAGVLPLR